MTHKLPADLVAARDMLARGVAWNLPPHLSALVVVAKTSADGHRMLQAPVMVIGEDMEREMDARSTQVAILEAAAVTIDELLRREDEGLPWEADDPRIEPGEMVVTDDD